MIRGVCVMMCVLRTGDEGCDFKYIFSSFNRDQESVRKRIYFRPPTVPSYLQRTNVLITSAVYLCSSHFIRIPSAGALALFHRLLAHFIHHLSMVPEWHTCQFAFYGQIEFISWARRAFLFSRLCCMCWGCDSEYGKGQSWFMSQGNRYVFIYHS